MFERGDFDMRKSIAFPAVLVALASPALAANWVFVGKNDYESTYEFDRETLIRDGSGITFWLRVHYGPKSPPADTDGYTARRHADCTDRSYQDLHTDYMKDGHVLRTTGEEEKHIASPDSIAAKVIATACSS
jgi:hypothetical protein